VKTAIPVRDDVFADVQRHAHPLGVTDSHHLLDG